MSDETRIVTVEQLAAALHRVESMADEHGDPTAPPCDSCEVDARGMFAALPTSTEGLDRAWMAHDAAPTRCRACGGLHDDPKVLRRINRFRAASLSSSPTETPEPTEEPICMSPEGHDELIDGEHRACGCSR